MSILLNCQPSTKKKHERKAKASSSSFSGIFPSMPVPFCSLPSPVCTGVVTKSSSSMVHSVIYSTTTPMVLSAPFVLPLDVTPAEPSCKRNCEGSSEDHLEMLAAFEKVWAAHK